MCLHLLEWPYLEYLELKHRTAEPQIGTKSFQAKNVSGGSAPRTQDAMMGKAGHGEAVRKHA